MKGKRVSYKWWWGWKPEVIEEWLEEQESQGWHLMRISLGGIRFEFSQGKSRKMSYAADYQSNVDVQYYAICKDAGWELVYSYAGWYIWRMEYIDSKPRLYTDPASRIEMNVRLRNLLIALLLCFLPLIFIALSHIKTGEYSLFSLSLLFMGLDVYGIYKINRHNKKLLDNNYR